MNGGHSSATFVLIFVPTLALLIGGGLAVRCYSCTGQCSPYSSLNANTTISENCTSCKSVVAYGGFGDLESVVEVSTQVCSDTSCTTGEEAAYSFQYLLNSYIYTMPAYSMCCNEDLCNSNSAERMSTVSVLWLTVLLSLAVVSVGFKFD